MMMQVKLSLAQWDNTNRINKFVSGRKHCMESGVWIGKRPLGYDKDGKSLNSQYTINATGKLIQKAFKWKLQGVDNFRIMDRLSAMGLNVSKQKLHKILTNPFYAGKIQSKFTDGEIIDGKHPALISWVEFLQVQEILSGRTGVYKVKAETPRFPLKRHIRCAEDGLPLTAYTVKRKNIDYYKCNRTRSSGTRTAAEAESKPKGGCCNQRLSGLMGDVAKISFQTQSHSKHEYLHSKQHPTIDKSAEAQHAERVPLSAQKDE